MKGNTHFSTADEYIDALEPSRKNEIALLDELIRRVLPSFTPYMQSGMLAYGEYHFRYASGRELDWPAVALANQKNYISLYICLEEGGKYIAELYKDRLPKANIGKSCIRFKKLSDIDLDVITEILLHTERALIDNPIVTKKTS